MNGPNSDFDQRNLILAIALSVVVLMAWQAMLPPPVQQMPNQPQQQTAPGKAGKTAGPVTPAGQPTTGAPAPVKPTAVVIQHRTLARLQNPDIHGIELSNVDGQIQNWTLYEEQYKVRSGAENVAPKPFTFIDRKSGKMENSVFLPPTIELSLSGAVAKGDYQLVNQGKGGGTATLQWTDPVSKVVVQKKYILNSDGYTVDMEMVLTNPTVQPVNFGLRAEFSALQNNSQAQASMFMPPIYLFNAVCMRHEEFSRLGGQDINEHIKDNEAHLNRHDDNIRWGGIDNRYFMTALMVGAKQIKSCAAAAALAGSPGVPPGFTRIDNILELQPGSLAAGKSITRKFSLYGGPKKLSDLSAQQPPLAEAIDFGMFSVICVPMLWLMRFFFEYLPNWGVAIILLTLLVKLITLPLTIKQYRSMAAMKKIQPKMKALQAKYKEDKVRMQQEMMKLYRDNKVNPLSGCLPMVMMMPIYFALYRTIYSAVELYQANFAGWIHDLSQQDPYYITPVLLGALMIIQMQLNPSAGDQMQQKILMWVMPIMFTGMMLFLPSGLVLYILVNTVLGIVQQWYMYRQAGMMPAKASA